MGKNNTYTEEDIITLSEVESIRQNPGMFIGSTVNPNHLLYEALDNALDEANNGYANLILVSIDTKNHIYTVADNGRGMPWKDDTIVRIATKLYTGGKFKKESKDGSYKAAIGMHGVGLVAVTALSEWVEITVYKDKKKVFYRFEDFKVVKKTVEDFDGKAACKTCIKFKPDKKFFETTLIDIKPLRTRMEVASVHIDKLQLISIVDDKKEVINMSMDQYFEKNYLGSSDKKNWTPFFRFNEVIDGQTLDIVYAWDLNNYSTAVTGGCINVLPVQQGTHISAGLLTFQDVFENIAKKEKLNYNPLDFKTGFRMFVSMQLFHTDFNSQTKEKFTTSKTKFENLFVKAAKSIEENLRSNPELFNKIVYYIDSYRKSLTAKKTIVKTNGTVSRYNVSIDSKLKDCSSTNVDICEIFITEGDSASGGLVQCRDPMRHAILGVRGKVPNISDGKKDYLKNKEFVEMINAFGTGCGRDFNIDGLRYGKIVIATDADDDGDHIKVLIITAILRFAPELIKQGKVYISILPLYGVRNYKGKFLPFYTDDEMQKFRDQHPDVEISRYKGLGEMMPAQLHECLLNPEVRRLIQLKCTDDEVDDIFKLMSDAESKRNLITEE